MSVFPQAHHIIPKNAFDEYADDIKRVFGLGDYIEFQQMGINFIHLHPEEKDATKVKELLEKNPNLFGDIPIGATKHQGSHNGYDEIVKGRLADIFDTKGFSDDDRRLMILDLQNGLKEALTRGIPPSINGVGFNGGDLIDFLNERGTLTPENHNSNAEGKSRADDIYKKFDADTDYLKRTFDMADTDHTNELAIYNAQRMQKGIKRINDFLGFLTDSAKNDLIIDIPNGTKAREILFDNVHEVTKFLSTANSAPVNEQAKEKLTKFAKEFENAISLSLTKDADPAKLANSMEFLKENALDAKAIKLLADLSNKNVKTATIDLKDIDFNKLKLESFTDSALWEVLNHIEQDENLKNMVDVQTIRMDLADHISQATGIDKAVRDEAKGFYEFHKHTNAISGAMNKNHSNVTVDKNGLIDLGVVVNGLKEAKPSLETLIQKFAESPESPKTPKLNTVGKIADFINNVYDGLIEGLSTNKWDKFFAEVKEHGVETIIGVGVGLVVVGLVSFVLGTVGTTALALAGIASVGFAAYELTTKVINTDWDAVIDGFMTNILEIDKLKDWFNEQTNDVIEGLADILTQFDKWTEKNSLTELLKDYKEVLDTKENTKEVFRHLKQVYEADTKFMGTENDDTLSNTTTEGDHILYGGKGNDTLTGNDKMDILIGGEGDDILNGNGGNDILGGNDGNDTLDGGIGNDILIGGEGNDEYKFFGNYGHDTIDDEDGRGRISIDDKAFIVGERIKGNVWYNDDKTYTIRAAKLNASDESYVLVISKNGDTANSITIKDWKQGKLGITLEGLDKPEKQEDTDGVVMGHDQGNIIIGHKNVNSLAGNDWVFGTREGDKILSGDGADVVTTGLGDDTIDSGDGNDLIFGGEGKDDIRSGSGDDVIFSSSVLYWAAGLSSYELREDTLIETFETRPEMKMYSNDFGWVVKYDISQMTPHNNSYYTYDSYHLLPLMKAYYSATTEKGRPYYVFFHDTKSATNAGEGYQGADVVYAGTGDDLVAGSSDGDALYGEQGKDNLYGLSGNDILDGGEGNDELVGGNGLDLLLGGSGDDSLIGGLDGDRLYGGEGNDELFGDLTKLRNINDLPESTPIDRFGNDYLDGGDGDDHMVGGLGNDTLIGGKGKDVLMGDFELLSEKHGDDHLDGGDGDDELFGAGGNDTLVGGKGNDFLSGDDKSLKEEHHGQDKLYGGEGNDALRGDGDDDYLDGGVGDDKLVGDNGYISGEYHGNDIIFGGVGNDGLWGQGGQDKLYGGEGNDYLDGDDKGVDGQYHADDYLDGGTGDDSLHGNGGNDVLIGGEGDDLLLGDQNGLDEQYHGNDILYGADGDDRMFGQGGNDTLYGGAGNDHLDSGDGDNDVLYGDSGNDTLVGGGRLEGGEGRDYYNVTKKAVVKDSDGDGLLFFNDKRLVGASIVIESDMLDKPSSLDFSEYGYVLNDSSTDRLQEVERGEGYVRYVVGGDNNFVYKNQLSTEGLMSGDLGVKFYVTVYTEDNNEGVGYEDDTDPFATEIQPPFTGFPPFIYPPFIGYPPFVEQPNVNLPPFAPPKNPPTLSDPLVLDLNHNGKIDTIHLSRGVNFDLDGNRFAEQTSWVNGDDGFVVLDLNNNGRIDNGGELFGTDTLIQSTNRKASDGFLALAQYDKNKDGLISTDDEIYKHLKIWQDKNQDGISQSDELKTLEEHGIIDIGLSKQSENKVDGNQVLHTYQGVFNQMITTSQTQNNITTTITTPKQGIAKTLLFQVNTSNTKWQVNEDDVGISDEIKALPNLAGYGTVKSLHQAISEDKTDKLKELLNQFAKAGFSEQSIIAEQILIHWTGQANTKQGQLIEGRVNLQQLEVLKALWGKEHEWRNVGLSRFVKGTLENAYQDTLNSLHAGLLTQTHHKPWVQMIDFKINEHTYKGVTEKVYQADFLLLVKRVIDVYRKDAGYGEKLIKELDFTIKYLDINHSQLYNDWLQQFSGFAKETQLEHLTLLLSEKANASTHNDVITATDQNDVINAQDGNDVIVGGKGNDELQGGMGSDTYVFGLGDGHDVIRNYDESFSKLDTIYFTKDINPSQVQAIREGENLILQYSDNDSVTVQDFFDSNGATDYRIDQIQFANGVIWDINNILDRVLQGTADDDILTSFIGRNDRLTGKQGNDTYHINESGDEVIENAEEGEDIVISDIDYALTQNVENLTLTNNQTAITATGNTLNNTLIGNTLNNTLDGKEGVDTLIGGTGDDTYGVDNSQDVILELENEGDDRVIASSDYALSDHLESLTLVGTAVNGIGNALDNILLGNAQNNRLEGKLGNDSLDGGLGADVMVGGEGNDTYYIDNVLDEIIEHHNEGNDVIISQVNYTLPINTEILTLSLESNAITATGNELDNHITGNAQDNVIDGKAGADALTGGLGNDYYILDNEFDIITEYLNEGDDTLEQHTDRPFYNFDEFGNPIKTGSYHLLFDNIENLILKGTTKTAFGNYLDNTITLNEQSNFVNALSGNDTIIYQKGGGRDTILSTDNINSKDSLVIEGYDLSEASFVRVTNTASAHDMLQIRFKGSNDQITLIDYFANEIDGYDNRIDQISFKKGGTVTTLSQSEFEAKILAQGQNTAPKVNKYPKPVTAHIGKELLVQFDKDTIKDADPYDSELSYKITLATKDSGGQYQPIPEWLSFDPVTLTLKGTPPEGTKGNLQFILWGEDSFNYSAGAFVNLSVVNVPSADTTTTPKPTNPATPTTPQEGNLVKDTKGNDTLKGDGKDTTFVYTGGKDTLTDTGGKDTLVFGNGITFNQVGQGLMQSGNDLVLRVNGSTANQITLKNFFADPSSIIETIKFEAGGQIDYKQIYSLFGKTIPADTPAPVTDTTTPATPSVSSQNNFVGTNKADKLTGTDGNDQLQGLAGADTLTGNAGNDVLIGGAGNDTLMGGTGNDLYYFTKGFGKDTIVNTGGGYDNIYFEDISFNQVGSGLVKSGNNLILKVKGTADELTLKDFFLGGDNASLNVHFKDGGSISNTQLLNAFKFTKTPTHTDTQGFNASLEIALGLMEEFKELNGENGGII